MRILIADGQSAVRSELRSILAKRVDWEVCAEAAAGGEAVTLAKRHRPDVVIVDLNLPSFSGFAAATEIKHTLAGVELIVLTSVYSKAMFYEILKLGALGFVLKSDAERDLIPAVAAVHRRESYISRNLDALLPSSPRTTPLEAILSGRRQLTPAERAEVRSIAEQIRQLI